MYMKPHVFEEPLPSILAVGTLPMLGFVSEDTVGLEASSCVAFTIKNTKETACNLGMTYHNVHY